MSTTPGTDNSGDVTGFQPISRQSVSAQVGRQLQQYIAQKKLHAGDRLPPERNLASVLEVSRTAVRDALKLLATYGVVEIRQGVGTFVKEPQQLVLLDSSLLGSEDRRVILKQATSVRTLIECEVAALAAEHATEDDLRALEACLARADSEPERMRRAQAIDLSFEALLGQATRNPYLIAVQREAHRFFQSAWEGCGFIPRPAEERSRQHWRILEAVSAHDVTRARSLMAEHLDVQALTDAGSPNARDE